MYPLEWLFLDLQWVSLVISNPTLIKNKFNLFKGVLFTLFDALTLFLAVTD